MPQKQFAIIKIPGSLPIHMFLSLRVANRLALRDFSHSPAICEPIV
jgi:hypothetical protein